MMNGRYIMLFILSCCLFNTVEAQDSLTLRYEVVSDNIDSLISDSLYKEFIQAHPPLTASQLSKFKRAKVSGAYGNYVTSFIDSADFYKVNNSPLNLSVSFRKHRHVEWMFYYLMFLVLLLALVQVIFPSYLSRSLRGFFTPNAVQTAGRDFHQESTLPSFFLGLLFFFSGAFFIYSYSKNLPGFASYSWVQLISVSFFSLFIIYGVKFVFLKFLSWVFNQQDAFDRYIGIVFSMNETLGLLLLALSFLIAYVDGAIPPYVYAILTISIIVVFFFRVLGAFKVFSKQARMGFFEFSLSFLSIELLPTLVLWKFIHDQLLVKLALLFRG
jgi:hypothetical protein